jgi:hypothetical protein
MIDVCNLSGFEFIMTLKVSMPVFILSIIYSGIEEEVTSYLRWIFSFLVLSDDIGNDFSLLKIQYSNRILP